ncbi:hypothetical protein ACCT08_35320 [Rhizobium johnstonii]|uniref:hypothetical protein n=1 Tax=Rhizobium johnstonii TaxID=3019933 RepID=UPI003F9477F7
MKLSEYITAGRDAHSGLAKVVAAILEAAIAKDGSLRLQQIQHRAKAVESLRRKLAKVSAAEDADIEPNAKDLAGVRLVFYTNSDVNRFLQSGILRSNFEIDWERTKFHHPTGNVQDAADLFVSNNYVVRLKEPRSELPEYADFEIRT